MSQAGRLAAPEALLGGMNSSLFMRRHWQKKPLLVRQAWPGVTAPVTRAQLFDLAARDDVESRLVLREGRQWQVRFGPFARRALPPLAQPRWTLLVQGLDLLVEPAHAMMQRFAFVPAARLDDLMLSYASDGGGVGPHWDSYDVFLLQVQGRRHWRWGRLSDPSLRPGLPLKILSRFEPSDDAVLEPGDMLYLPPRWGHDGVARGECMTCSIGFRVPSTRHLTSELLTRWGDLPADGAGDRLYRDPTQTATLHPAAIPPALVRFAQAAVQQALREPQRISDCLGEFLSEPKPQVWFEAGAPVGAAAKGVRLDRRTRMLYIGQRFFINGAMHVCHGPSAALLRRLADGRVLDAQSLARMVGPARAWIDQWAEAGWLHER